MLQVGRKKNNLSSFLLLGDTINLKALKGYSGSEFCCYLDTISWKKRRRGKGRVDA